MTKISKHNNIITKTLGKLEYKGKEISFQDAMKLMDDRLILLYSPDDEYSKPEPIKIIKDER